MANSKIRNIFVGAIIRVFSTILGPQSMTYGENGTRRRAIIVGAGPAGLTAAWRLKNHAHIDSVVIESEGVVGGISRTVRIKGWSFDLGGHRFFTKSSLVNEIWDEMLYPDTFLMRPRKSRIYYAGKYFDYPLKPLNALLNLGVIETIRCIGSYILVKIRPRRNNPHLRIGLLLALVGVCIRFFSRHIQRKCGEFPPENCNQHGLPRESKTSHCLKQ